MLHLSRQSRCQFKHGVFEMIPGCSVSICKTEQDVVNTVALVCLNGRQLAKMKKSIPDMSLP